ncbi:hypothetical protein F2P81_013101 [Scophthalmus maximus]|uniref:Protein SHQ1 homolog n=1 Tax=Scophthalmus maximus TaxID=52904 RepID=A0A6A4SMV9_SCOMX|nr:hypothetical protein F2P81_013101 [Scophthalmus maximus]
MITPAFDLSQDPEYLILSIRVPYTRTSEFDLYVDGTDFKFFAKPYFLRLTLPGRIVEDGREKAKFDIDKGLFILRVPKETAGEHFEGLQMLTSLLAPKGSRSAKPLVEDLSSGCSESVGDEEEEDEEDFDWQVEQEVYTEQSEEELKAQQKYGFGNQRSGVFARLQEELSDVIDIKNPEGTTAAERRQGRLEAEASAFSPDHYLADFFEDDEIKGLLKFKPWWAKLSPSTEQVEEAACACTKLTLSNVMCRPIAFVKVRERFPALSSIYDEAYLRQAIMPSGPVESIDEPDCLPRLEELGGVTVDNQKTQRDAVLAGGESFYSPTHICVGKELLEKEGYLIMSNKVTAFAEMLQKASLRKEDLELELEELEEAATMVAEEEGASESAPISRGVCSGASSDSSGSSASSDESEESEAEGQGCTESSTRGGGGGGGGERSKDSPPQPQPTSTASPIPQEPPSTLPSAERKVDALPSASQGTRQLIQELGERVAEELKISQDSSCKAERSCSQLSSTEAKTEASGSGGSSGTLLELRPQRNPLLIVQPRDDPDDSDFLS